VIHFDADTNENDNLKHLIGQEDRINACRRTTERGSICSR
jgi:hypothetical protein